tara:strand:- start:418 stop:549 length:132 start_codon:yes stop_codon:yes gene_type:complete
MKKNILFIIILLFLTVSCGKKGDPEYQNSKNNNKPYLIIKKRV